MGPLKMFGSSGWVQPWAHCKLLTTLSSCANWPIHLSWQLFQSVSMAHLSHSAVLFMGPLMIFSHCCLMGPHGVCQCDRSIYAIPWSWAHSRCLAALNEFNNGPTVNYWQLVLAAPIGPSIYLRSSINGPTHAISQLLLDGPIVTIQTCLTSFPSWLITSYMLKPHWLRIYDSLLTRTFHMTSILTSLWCTLTHTYSATYVIMTHTDLDSIIGLCNTNIVY